MSLLALSLGRLKDGFPTFSQPYLSRVAWGILGGVLEDEGSAVRRKDPERKTPVEFFRKLLRFIVLWETPLEPTNYPLVSYG